MANSTIKAPVRFGAKTSITDFPYTTPKDGFITVRCVHNGDGTNGYLYLDVDGETSICLLPMAHGQVTGLCPVKKGQVISTPGFANLQYYWIEFMSIEGGGNRKVTPCNVAQVAA